MYSPYFFTALDSHYLAHSPRDPLGFQVIWVAPARKIIPHLSTVSTSARDFQILSYARFFCLSEGDSKFQRFHEFLSRFEQACGYARYIFGGDQGFNGIDRVRHRVANGEKAFYVSGNPQHGDCMLMSNQRNYGVYGKYFRPFNDMNIETDPDFSDAMASAFAKTGNQEILQKLLRRLFSEKPGDKIWIHEDELHLLEGLIMKRTETEQVFFRRKILYGDGTDSLQLRFFEYVRRHSELQEPAGGNWRLHEFIKRMLEIAKSDPELTDAFVEIRNTEKVLYPLWSIFAAFLYKKPFWNKTDIANESFFATGFSQIAYAFARSGSADIRDSLNELLNSGRTARDRLEALVKRNGEISKRRGGLPWVREENERYVILAKGARPPETIDQDNDNANGYFIPGYLNLFLELMASA